MDTKFKNVSETLLITLNARGKDADSPNSVLNDKKSAEIMSKIDYDFSKFDKGWMSYYGILARAKIMDQEIKKFIDKYPDCVIVSIGAGLDTRFSRIDNGKITWYNLDLPEVIEQRKIFFEEKETEGFESCDDSVGKGNIFIKNIDKRDFFFKQKTAYGITV